MNELSQVLMQPALNPGTLPTTWQDTVSHVPSMHMHIQSACSATVIFLLVN
jgi:hypothetical protein